MAVPTPARRTSKLFVIMALLAVAVNFLCAYINYVVWAPEAVNPTLRNLILDYGLASIVAGIAITVIAYLTSLRAGQARPRVLLYLLWFSFACGVAGYFLGAMGVTWDNFPAFIGTGVVCALLPLIPAWLERLVGSALGKSATALIDSGHAASGLRFQYLASVLQPHQQGESRRLGLALAALSRTDEALPYLEQAAAEGTTDPEVYSAMSDIYTTAKQQEKAVEATAKLYHIRQSPATLKRLVNLYLDTGRREEAVSAIMGLPEDEQRPWLDQLSELLLQLRRVDDAREIAVRLESDGPPFARARALLNRLIEQNPRYAAALEQHLALSRRVNDWKSVGQTLESLAAMAPGNTERRRELIQHLRFQDDTESVIHHLQALIQSGAATEAELLEVLKHWHSRGENRRVEKMIADNEVLGRSAEAVSGIL